MIHSNRRSKVETLGKDKDHDSWTQQLKDWLEFATKSLAILAGVFAIYQYIDSKKTARIKATLEYVDRFHSQDNIVNKAATATSIALRKNTTNIARLAGAELSNAQSEDLHRRLAETVLAQASDTIDVLLEIDSFFDTLRLCVDGNICDKDTAIQFFKSYASTFKANFGPVIQERSTLAPGFGRGITWMSNGGIEQ
jgi:hypothetical protein